MWGFRWQQVQREGIDLIVAIDTSRSMLATDVKPNRLARAKLAVQDLLAQLGGDRIGLVAFAGTAFLQCPLTLDFGAFSQSLEAIEAGIIPRGGTSLAAAIDASLGASKGARPSIRRSSSSRTARTTAATSTTAIKQATDRGVKIYTVGIGTSEGELIPLERGGFVKDRNGQVVKSRLDEDDAAEDRERHRRRLPARDRHGVRPRRALSRLHRDDGEARAREHARAPLRAPLPVAARCSHSCCCWSSR